MKLQKKLSARHAQRVLKRHSLDRAVCEILENRQLFAATTLAALPPKLAHPASTGTDNVDLSQYFNDPAITGTVVTLDTVEGPISVALTDGATPITVQNFLSYVTSGAYDNTFFHRSAVLSTNTGGSPTTPGDIIQAGGYAVSGNSINHITTQAPIADEFQSELYQDVAGTIAMAKTSAANSATSEFYFNVHDNSQLLDTPTDDNGTETSYTVFGTVIGNGMDVVDEIASLPTADLSNVNSALNTLPVTGINEADVATAGISESNLVFINSAKVVPTLTYTVTSDNTTLVQPAISGSTLSFTYGAGLTGSADITVSAVSADGVTQVSQTFTVTVPDTTKPNQGPTAVADTSPDIVSGTTGTVHPLANDTDSVAALVPSSLVVTTQPANGTATIDPSTGYITYSANPSYIGVDTLQYEVRDTNGTLSAPATISFNVVPTPVQITIGTPTAKDLTYTQPDGTVAVMKITGATALITFSSYQVQSSTLKGHVTASGEGATIQSITFTNTGKALATFTMTATGGLATLNNVSGGQFSKFSALNTNLIGTLALGKLTQKLALWNATGATIEPGKWTFPSFSMNNATDTNFDNGIGGVYTFKVNEWLDPNNDTTINCENINSVIAAGEFTSSITVTKVNYFSANVGSIGGGTWTIPGVITIIKTNSVAAGWSLSCNNYLFSMKVAGDYSGTVSAGAIKNFTVGGNVENAVIQTQASWSKNFEQLGVLKVGGSITGTNIVAAGNIGSVIAGSMSHSGLYAGVSSSVIQNLALPASSSDFTATGAYIKSIAFTKPGTFADADIAAGVLGNLKLGTVTSDNSGTSFGLAAHTIGGITARLDTGAALALTKTQLKDSTTLAAWVAAHSVTLADFAIDLLSS